MSTDRHAPSSSSALAMLTMGAIGVVFGDIGTSVLYAFQAVFEQTRMAPTQDNVLGVLSMFMWALIVVVAIKYVGLVMRADNDGEGGMMALLALASRSIKERPRTQALLLSVGSFGVALFYGDGIITPAISVLSAVEGMEVITPAAKPYVIPITLIVLVLLFSVQQRGTGHIGRFFGPVMVLWFLAIGGLGLWHVLSRPVVFQALLPVHAIGFSLSHPGLAFIILGAVFLCLTGAEALYADMGHFGVRPIRLAWFGLVMPALMLNYLGQGALVLAQPAAVANPFYRMAPGWAVAPLVGLATAATVIASQALISGAFSAARQSIQLGFLPRMRVLHTSNEEIGQVYVPAVNWLLLAGVLFAVGMFRSSGALAAAYGISVSLLMVITTVLTYFVVRHGWRYPLAVALPATVFFLAIDLFFFSSNALKLAEGGWFPLLIAGVVFTAMATWRRGSELVREKTRADSMELKGFLESLFISPPQRVPGTAVFMSAMHGMTPSALMHSLKHYKVLHAQNLFVTVRNHEVPWVGDARRLEHDAIGPDCWQVVVNYGFQDEVDIPKALQPLQREGVCLDTMITSYFLSRAIVVPTLGGGMPLWREKLFAQMYLNASSAAEFLKLPSNSVVELGSKVEI